DAQGLREALHTFPDPDPTRQFSAPDCVRAILRGGRQAIDIPREAAAHKGIFRRSTFWDLLMEVTGEGEAIYSGYSYRERADRYLREFTLSEAERLRVGSESVKYSTLREQIRSVGFTR